MTGTVEKLLCAICEREESLPLNHVFTLYWSPAAITTVKGFERRNRRGCKRDYVCSILCATKAHDRWAHHGTIEREVSTPRANPNQTEESDEQPQRQNG